MGDNILSRAKFLRTISLGPRDIEWQHYRQACLTDDDNARI